MEKVANFLFGKTSRSSWINSVQSSKFKVQGYHWVIVFGILLLAAFLRLYKIQDYMTFLGDEGRDVLVVYNILHGNLTLLGPTASVGGFFLGPIYYYFMAPFLWFFNYNPVGPAVMVAFFGIATVWLIYKMGSEFLGTGVGLIAAILYSIAPLVIAYSRSSWNPNLMPFFSLLSLYILYRAVIGNKIRLFVLSGFLLGISMQLHYLATFLGVIMAVYMLIARIFPAFYSSSDPAKRGSREVIDEDRSRQDQIINFEMGYKIMKDYLYIFLGFLIGWLPFLLFEVRHGFPNLRSIINFIIYGEEAGGSSRFFAIIENVFFRIFGRLVTNFPPPEQVSLQAHFQIAVWYYLTLALALLSTVVLAYTLLRRFGDQKEFPKISLLVVWLVVGVGLFGFYKKPIYDYYFGFMFPLPFMLVGLTISGLYTNLHESFDKLRTSMSFRKFTLSLSKGGQHEFTRIRILGKVLAVAIFIAIVWINIQGIPFRFPPNRQLAQVEEISRFVIEKTDNKPFNFALITGGNSDHAYRYFFTLWGKQPVAIENPQKDPERKTATEQLLIVCETSPCAPLGHSLWEIAGFGRAEIVGEWSVSVVKVYKLIHYRRVVSVFRNRFFNGLFGQYKRLLLNSPDSQF